MLLWRLVMLLRLLIDGWLAVGWLAGWCWAVWLVGWLALLSALLLMLVGVGGVVCVGVVVGGWLVLLCELCLVGCC